MEKIAYKFDLDATIAEFYSQCPHLKKNIMIIDPGFTAKWNRQKLAEEISNQLLPEDTPEKTRQDFNGLIRSSLDNVSAASINCQLDSRYTLIICQPSIAIGFHIEQLFYNLLSPETCDDKQFQQQFQHFSFDHELGHALDPIAPEPDFTNYNQGECIADSYATLRHVQRYGFNTGFLENWKHLRTIEAMIGETVNHYTLPTIEGTVDWLAKNDIQGLNPEKLLAIALDVTDWTQDEGRNLSLDKALKASGKTLTPFASKELRCKEAAQNFLIGAKDVNSPHIDAFWQKWRQALVHFNIPLPDEQTLRGAAQKRQRPTQKR